jgi:hypothetical protein
MNKIQEIILKLIEETRFNEFRGKEVAKDLRENEDKWKGVIFGRFCYFTLLPLRDIDEGYYNADTIFIKLPKENLGWLKEMVKKWKVDEFGYYLDGKLEGIVDDNLRGLARLENKNCSHFYCPLGASPEKGMVYARLWWD